VPGGAIDFQLNEIGATIPDLSDHGRPFQFDPLRRPGQGMHEAPQMRFPSPNLEVEIVLSIPHSRTGLRCFPRGSQRRLRKCRSARESEHCAQQTGRSNRFHAAHIASN
jgi:hypothetical protein